MELCRARNVHQNGLESEEPFFGGRLSVHDHSEGDRFEGVVGWLRRPRWMHVGFLVDIMGGEQAGS